MQCGITAINAMQCIVNKAYIVVAGGRDGAYHDALYDRELHDLHKCI